MADTSELSIEETNRIRAGLGLKPLAVDNESKSILLTNTADCITTDNDEERALNNYKQLEEQRRKEQKAQELKERLERSKNRREQILKGRSLGEEMEEDLDDAAAWVERSRRKQAEISDLKNKEESAMKVGKDAQVASYTSADIEGIKVIHDIGDIIGQDETILVLKDTSVLDEGDNDIEMVNIHLAERERQLHNIENKLKKKPNYDEDMNEKSLLVKYDEKKQRSFVLGNVESISGFHYDHVKKEETVPISLDYEKVNEASDYQEPSVIPVFRKQKKRRVARHQKMGQAIGEEDIKLPDNLEGSLIGRGNYVDDDDLQLMLSKKRVNEAKFRKLESLKYAAHEVVDQKENEVRGEGLVISETTGFVENLSIMNERNTQKMYTTVASTEERHYSRIDEIDRKILTKKDEDLSETDAEPRNEETVVKEIIEEPTIDSGLASTLKLLKQKGVIEKRGNEDIMRDQLIREHQKWRLKRKMDAEKTAETEADSSISGRKLTKREEEELREQRRAKELEDRFKNYKPAVNLVYRDEFGRVLDAKEAYKQLSYKFHGRQPGKLKTERRLRKIAEEMAAQKSESSITRGLESIIERQKESGAAHVVLSVGSKGNAPKISKTEDH